MKRALLAVSALALMGCVSTNAVRLGAMSKRVPVPVANVAIYRTAEQVPGRYEEVALLKSTGDTMYSNEAALFNSMRKKAGKMGANAIILGEVQEPSAGAKLAGALAFGLFGGMPRKGSAIAIYVFPETMR